MGWSWRRSVSLGPVRVNLSRSGAGVSAGVRGARVSIGPRGTYVHLGAGGFRYTQRLDTPAPDPRHVPARPPGQGATSGAGVGAEPIDTGCVVESGPDELLEEVRRKQAKLGLVSLPVSAGAVGLCVFFLMAGAEAPSSARWVVLAAGLLAFAFTPWAAWHDRRAKTVRVRYVADPLGEQVREAVERLLGAFQRAHALWSVHSEFYHGDTRRNAGAGTSVTRRPVRAAWGAPPFVETNARVGFLEIDGTRLYFFPDRLLIFGGGEVRGVAYTDLGVKAGEVRFVEDGTVPRDARVLGHSWRFVNKDGSPDRRFANNYQLPLVAYGTLELSSPSGLRVNLQTSADRLAQGSAELLKAVQEASRDLASRRVAGPLPEAPPAFADDPPPLILPGLAVARGVLDALSFRWLAALPDWSIPIAWGLIFSFPLVALAVRFAGPGGRAANAALVVAFVTAGAGSGTLAYESLRARRSRLAGESDARRSRFRAVLMSELKSRPPSEVDFAALVEDSGTPRADADTVADGVFRRFADRVVADGVITRSERTKLSALAKALEMERERAERLEGEAKSERYRAAVSDALADGTVTEEEARSLNELQFNLGVQDSPWEASDLLSPT